MALPPLLLALTRIRSPGRCPPSPSGRCAEHGGGDGRDLIRPFPLTLDVQRAYSIVIRFAIGQGESVYM